MRSCFVLRRWSRDARVLFPKSEYTCKQQREAIPSGYLCAGLFHHYTLDGVGFAVAEDENLAVAEDLGYPGFNSRVADSIRGFKISRVIGIAVGGNGSWIVSVTILPTNKMRPLVTIGCHRELTTVRADKCLVVVSSIGINADSVIRHCAEGQQNTA